MRKFDLTRLLIPLLVIAALALTACGRAGAPLSPYDVARKQAKKDGTPPPERPVKERSFVLDGLLD